jgi:hypothetical protein
MTLCSFASISTEDVRAADLSEEIKAKGGTQSASETTTLLQRSGTTVVDGESITF